MAKAVKKKGANGYKMPDPIAAGEILQGVDKNKKFRLGPSIGTGGFGEIYSAQEAFNTSKNYPYVVKIEPHENGPLFVENHFYTRNAKAEHVKQFCDEKKIKFLGMPVYIASGSHEYKGTKYRFLVMEKFGSDIWKIFLSNNRCFSKETVFKLGLQTLNVLEYIHSRGYIHADIKGANILLGENKNVKNQTYLVDFGLACKFTQDKDFKINPKKAHDGTIEYLSRDFHKGVATRRGDLEILAYNMIQWLGCTLPWENDLANSSKVQESKEKNMADIDKFMKACFKDQKPPTAIVQFLKYINTLSHIEEPNYEKIRKLFITAIQSEGGKVDGPLDFKGTPTTLRNVPKSPGKRKQPSKTKVPAKKAKKNDISVDEDSASDSGLEQEEVKPKNKGRGKKLVAQNKDSDMEEFVDEVKPKPKGRAKKATSKDQEEDDFQDKNEENPELKSKPKGRPKKTVEKASTSQNNNTLDPYDGFTPAMRELAMKSNKNGAKPKTTEDSASSKPKNGKTTRKVAKNDSIDDILSSGDELTSKEPSEGSMPSKLKRKNGENKEHTSPKPAKRGRRKTVEEDSPRKPTNLKKSKNLQHIDELEENSMVNDSMEGFNEEMKQLHKKVKAKNSKDVDQKHGLDSEKNVNCRSRRNVKPVKYVDSD